MRRRWWGAPLIGGILLELACCAQRSEPAPAAQEAAQAAAPAAMAKADSAPGKSGDGEGGGAKDKAKSEGKGEADKGEVKSWKRAGETPNASRLKVGDKEQLPLDLVEAHVTIEGFRARVLLDYTYRNDRAQRLEGNFQLRLPDEASPYYFAFGESAHETGGDAPVNFMPFEKSRGDDGPAAVGKSREGFWLQPREARMVPRDTAARAYTETVKQRVDPALVEWQGASVFSARVFPLMPRKSHRIVMGYDADLTRVGDDLEFHVDLPADAARSAVTVSVKTMTGGEPVLTPVTKVVAAEGEARHYRFEGEKAVTVRLRSPGAVGLVGARGDDAYFAASFRPELPRVAAAPSERAVFLLDTSLSAHPDKFNIWLKLLRSVLDSNRGKLKKFNVLLFGVDQRWFQQGFADNTPENVAALSRLTDGLALEGATDLGAALAQAARPSWEPAGELATHDVFLLSDGAATWGESEAFALSKRLNEGRTGALFAYTTGLAGTDNATLAHLARESGGAVFAVTSEQDVAAAAVAHNQRPWRIKSVKVNGVTDALLSGRPGALFPGQQVLLAGKGSPAEGAPIELVLQQGDRVETIRTKLDRTVTSKLAPRVYGAVATGQLEEFMPATTREAQAFANHFRITGKSSSLLMLESEADYQRYKISADDDRSLVQATTVGDAVARALRAIGELLGDAKTGFLGLVRRLGEAEVGFQPSPPLKAAIESLPVKSFEVNAPPLVVKQLQASLLPAPYLDALQSHKLAYDLVSTEAARRLSASGPGDALRAMSSLVEENPGDAVLLRDVGYAALSWGLGGQSYHLFRRVTEQRPFEPLNYQGLARSLVALKQTDLAMLYYQILIDARWNARFGDLPEIVGFEYGRLLRRIESGELKTSLPELQQAATAQVRTKSSVEKADLVVLISWNTDNSDVDLHVVEPGGEECYYGHRETRSGGKLTKDVTQGYGPEMYVLPAAPRGKYQIRARYFAQERNRLSARTKVYATVIRRLGQPGETVTEKVVTLETGKQMHDILDLDL